MMTNLQSELRPHLDIDESLLWTGTPKKGIAFRAADILLIPFSLFWCGFAVFWTYGAMKSNFYFGLFGLFFVFVGLNLVFTRFIIDAKRRGNTVYGITENRIIIKSGIFSKTVKSLSVYSLRNLEIEESGDGKGTIYLAPKTESISIANNMGWWPGVQNPPMLEMIPNARKVFHVIVELQKKSGKF